VTTPVPLIGRAAELARLAAAVDRAGSGRGCAVLIAGEPGVGKSRLVTEALAVAARRGFTILTGSAYPTYGDLAYAPFLAALGPYLDGLDSARADALVRGLPDLGRLFSGLRTEPPRDLGDPGLERARLLDAVARLLVRMAADRPVALFVDDLHWADPASLDLFQYLARGLAGQRMLLATTYRRPELLDGGRLGELTRLGVTEQIDLGPLPPERTAELVDALLGGAAPEEVHAAVAARTGGTPLFVAALVMHLVDTGGLRRERGVWTAGHRSLAAVPPLVRDLVAGRLERLDPVARDLLEWIAVAGDAAVLPVLSRVRPGGETGAALRRLADAGFVTEVPDGRSVSYRPSHPMFAEVVYAELGETLRRERHAALAKAVEEVQPGAVEQLAHHYRGAGDALPAGRALDVLLDGANRATEIHAAEEAVLNLSAALDAARAVRPAMVGELLERLGHAQSQAVTPRPRSPPGGPRWRSTGGRRAGRATARLDRRRAVGRWPL
jgi:predicted ATPase